jgi:futalosine hydrolase
VDHADLPAAEGGGAAARELALLLRDPLLSARRLLVLVPTRREAELLLGAAAHGLGAPALRTIAGRRVDVALTGIGLAAAGASASRWFAQTRPAAAVLVGLCGTFDRRRLAVGEVVEATAIACDGIGAGEGRDFVEVGEPLHALRCAPARARPRGAVRGEVLSVAAAAGSARMVATRRARHPRALAEEMEGYAVALAARLAGVPLTILRGASNVAGDRVHRRWKIAEALARCREALEAYVGRAASS